MSYRELRTLRKKRVMSTSAHHRWVPLAIANDVSAAREVAAKVFRVYRDLPAYAAMLDRGDTAEPVALVGDPSDNQGRD
jgi:hypothetical protein